MIGIWSGIQEKKMQHMLKKMDYLKTNAIRKQVNL